MHCGQGKEGKRWREKIRDVRNRWTDGRKGKQEREESGQ